MLVHRRRRNGIDDVLRVERRLNGPGCTYATTAHDRAHWDYSTGFRCCADPV